MEGPRISGTDNVGERKVEVDLSLLAIVIVTYNPDLEILRRQLSQLPATALRVVVDNASRAELHAEIVRMAEEHGVTLLQNEMNMGLPAALNRGARHAQQIRSTCRLLLLLDQDTEPGTEGVEHLVTSYGRVMALVGKPCCLGPRLVDVATGLDHGFHQIRGWRWSRFFPALDCHTPVPLANLNGSGTLMSMTMFNALGGLEEDFFIDHVDTEWAFRVLAAGYGLYGAPDVVFGHRMGELSRRFWFLGWRIWPDRSPQRHYYLFRNAVRLMSRSYVPGVWKSWALIKLGLTLVVHATIDPARSSQIRHMARGIKDGVRLAKSESQSSITPKGFV